MPSTPVLTAPNESRCPNCGFQLLDRFCTNCGAEAPRPEFGFQSPSSQPTSNQHGIQTLLLSLGALCLVVAVIAFGALAWSRLNAASQGAVLYGATIALAGAAAAAARRGLRATAEALGVVAAVAALVDVQAVQIGLFPDSSALHVWAGGTALVALLAWGFDRSFHLTSARATALFAMQLPGLCLAFGAGGAEWSVGPAILLTQSLLLLAYLRFTSHRVEPQSLVAIPIVGAALAWLIGTAWALFLVLLGFPNPEEEWFSHAHNPWFSLAVFGGAGLIAAGVSAVWGRNDLLRGLASVVAAGIAVIGAGLGLSYLGGFEPGWLVMALAGAAVVVVAALLPKPWRGGPAVVGVITAALWSLGGLEGLVRALIGSLDAAGEPWGSSVSDSVGSLLDSTMTVSFGPTAVVLIVPAALAGLGWWRQTLTQRLAISILAATAVAASTVVPLALNGPVWLAVLLPVIVAVAAASTALTGLERPGKLLRAPDRDVGVALVTALAALALAACWASTSLVATIVLLGFVLVAALLLGGVAGARRDEDSAVIAALVAVCAASGLGGAVAVSQGASVAQAWLTVALVTAACSFAGWVAVSATSTEVSDFSTLSLRKMLRRLDRATGTASAAIHVLVLLVVANIDAATTSWILLSGAVALAAHATRPDRRHLAFAAMSEALAFLWLRLAIDDVKLVEAYTLPLAVLLVVIGAWTLLRDEERSSWDTLGPGLVLSLAPTVLLSILESGTIRPLAAVGAGALVLVFGVARRLQAPLTIGAVAVGVVATRQLLPAAAGMPPFLVFGIVGAVLLTIGATFEQRRRDLVDLRDRFETLR